MSVETDTPGAVCPSSAHGMLLGPAAPDLSRPNLSGDLSDVLAGPPMFRRAVVGYDRFQVDSYVRWAEDELLAADREREHLVGRHLQTRTDLDAARQLLAHSSGGAEMLRMSQRAGSVLAAAADEAENIRAEAEAHRHAAVAEANRRLGYARWRISYAEAKARRVLRETTAAVAEMATAASRIVAEAEQTRAEARAEAEARLAEAGVLTQQATAHAGQVRQRALEDAAGARLQARGEIIAMLSSARDQRLRADAAAAATRDRETCDAVTRRASLLAEVSELEHRRTALRAEIELLTQSAAASAGMRPSVHAGRLLGKFYWRSRSLRSI